MSEDPNDHTNRFTIKVFDDETWKAIKAGQITGLSMGGKAQVKELNIFQRMWAWWKSRPLWLKGAIILAAVTFGAMTYRFGAEWGAAGAALSLITSKLTTLFASRKIITYESYDGMDMVKREVDHKLEELRRDEADKAIEAAGDKAAEGSEESWDDKTSGDPPPRLPH